jgi:ribulose-phosphate 3-epimerase
MSVNPGFGGQSFIETTYEKVKKLSTIIKKSGASTQIEIDGGVTDQNAKQLIECGADVLVAGSFVFLFGKPQRNHIGIKKYKVKKGAENPFFNFLKFCSELYPSV